MEINSSTSVINGRALNQSVGLLNVSLVLNCPLEEPTQNEEMEDN